MSIPGSLSQAVLQSQRTKEFSWKFYANQDQMGTKRPNKQKLTMMLFRLSVLRLASLLFKRFKDSSTSVLFFSLPCTGLGTLNLAMPGNTK